MLVDAAALMPGRVTVLKRLRAGDGRGADEWRATRLHGAFWAATEAGSPDGSGYAGRSPKVAVQVPGDLCGGYVEPGAYDGAGWTLAVGDVAVRGAFRAASRDWADVRRELEASGLAWATVNEVRDLRLGAAASGLEGLARWASVLYAGAA